MRKQIFLGVLSLTLTMVMGCAAAQAPVAAPIEEIEVETTVEETVFVEVELLVVEPEPEEVVYGYVALTFDDGPVGKTETLLEGLSERNVKATFFCLGVQAAKYPDTVQRIVDEGHQLANHSYSHLNMTKVTQEEWQEDFQKTEDLFNQILDRDGDVTYWLRPPYGLINRSQYSSVDVPMVLWSVDPEIGNYWTPKRW
ncbi:polysaccharide deacetylase family protein [Bengtsoniella intestinalis]|uniref:polysaccharide deacetylase family protein n=1 Tax=Bengtsoniella intestinalis TaxID=3073143 RepID=UPI00391F6B91